MSTIPRMNAVVWDEIFGRVAKENYDNIKHLCHKIAESYDFVWIISHNDEIKDWCDDNVVVKKENNISKIVLK
jgi:DNA repair exonuclease SbcCD ATPase subunit